MQTQHRKSHSVQLGVKPRAFLLPTTSSLRCHDLASMCKSPLHAAKRWCHPFTAPKYKKNPSLSKGFSPSSCAVYSRCFTVECLFPAVQCEPHFLQLFPFIRRFIKDLLKMEPPLAPNQSSELWPFMPLRKNPGVYNCLAPFFFIFAFLIFSHFGLDGRKH